MAGRQAILHIGTEKTGTTTLQRSLAMSADALARSGFRYPLLGAGHAHAALVAYAKTKGNAADLPSLGGWHPDESRASFEARIEEELAREVAKHPRATFIFSSEHASSRLTHPSCISRLKALLDRHFTDVRICVYLRRWDRMALSAFSTFVRHGLADPSPFRHFLGTSYLDYAGLLARWEAAFGRDRMHVALFERGDMIGGSIVSDFASRHGLPELASIADANTSSNFDTLRALALINGLLAERSAPNAAAIAALLIADLPKQQGSLSIPPQQARRFNRRYAEQAEAIRSRYFPERTALFDDNYDEYGSRSELPVNSWRSAAELLLNALQRTAS